MQRVFSNSNSTGGDKKKDKGDDQIMMAGLINSMVEDLSVVDGLDDEIGSAPNGGAGGSAGGTAQKLHKFVNNVATLDTDGLKKMRESEILSLSTIHEAKGLEFSHVWVVQMAEGVCPLRPNLEQCEDEEQMERQRNENLQEERRVAYVALTRAKHHLSISWVSTDQQTGEQQEPSRFIQEIPEEFKISAKAAAAARANPGGASSTDPPPNQHQHHHKQLDAPTSKPLHAPRQPVAPMQQTHPTGTPDRPGNQRERVGLGGGGGGGGGGGWAAAANIGGVGGGGGGWKGMQRDFVPGISYPTGARPPDGMYATPLATPLATPQSRPSSSVGAKASSVPKQQQQKPLANQQQGLLCNLPDASATSRAPQWGGKSGAGEGGIRVQGTNWTPSLVPRTAANGSTAAAPVLQPSRSANSINATSNCTVRPQNAASSWGARSSGVVLQPWLSGRASSMGKMAGAAAGHSTSSNMSRQEKRQSSSAHASQTSGRDVSHHTVAFQAKKPTAAAATLGTTSHNSILTPRSLNDSASDVPTSAGLDRAYSSSRPQNLPSFTSSTISCSSASNMASNLPGSAGLDRHPQSHLSAERRGGTCREQQHG